MTIARAYLVGRAPPCGLLRERVCELGFGPREPTEHPMTHRGVDHGLTRCSVPFIIFALSTIPPQPAKGPLHDPAFGQDNEAFQPHGSKYGLGA
jgi:hypothetical protein